MTICPPVKLLQADFDTLYKDMSYPALSAATCKLNILLSESSREAMPYITLNSSVRSWIKSVQPGPRQDMIDAIIKNSQVRIKFPENG